MLLITDAAIGITIWALLFRKQTPELAPDYAPQEAEEYAESVEKISWAPKESRKRLLDIAVNNLREFADGNCVNVVNR
ncbi:hypothetical protein PMF13cell1_02893 [Blautia producta]|uniref:Uncharacterized protein n=1 Tax=Blautia producta TaxID=33035 RepID=A0A4P6M1Y1_9FIRM|nr:hypothetical protein PMF13cell1_02893 [Blautia producta]